MDWQARSEWAVNKPFTGTHGDDWEVPEEEPVPDDSPGMLDVSVREPTPEDYVRSSARQSSSSEVTESIKTKVLSDEMTDKLLKRAPAIKSSKDDEKRFFKRSKSKPAPKTGERVKIPFPPSQKLDKPEQLMKEEAEMRKELKVLRYMPEGKDLDVVPEVTVTFNQPMVPVTGVGKLKDIPVPVKMSPKIEGEWRWAGTKTVKWKPSHRLPKSTEFEVTILKGAKSELSCKLKKKLVFKFSTVPLKFDCNFPGGGSSYSKLSENGILFINFNQKIDKKKIFEYLRVVCNNDRKAYKIKPLTETEVRRIIDSGEMKKKRPSLYSTYEMHLRKPDKDNSVWFTFTNPLKLGSSFNCTLSRGAVSKEGPRETPNDQSFSFSTYGALKMTYRYPQNHEKITPLQSWSVSFNNNLELETFDADKMVKIVPKLVNQKVTASGLTINISGSSKGQTNYKVTFTTALEDVYGQKLAKETSTIFKVGRARQTLQGFYQNNVVVLDPTMSKKNPTFSFITVNIDSVRVCAFQVHPKEFHKSWIGGDYYYYTQKYGGYGRNWNAEQSVGSIGKKVYDKTMKVVGKADEITETTIDLTPFLQNKKSLTGQIVMYVEPTKGAWKDGEFRSRPKVITWLQVTKIGVDCHWTTGGEIYAWGTKLQNGGTVRGANFSIVSSAGKANAKYDGLTQTVVGDDDGLAFISSTQNDIVCWIEKDGDIAFVQTIDYVQKQTNRYLSYIVNDRNLYKPKETVTIKGILRHLKFDGHSKKLSIPVSKDVGKINYECTDSRGSRIKKGTLTLDKNGHFMLEIELKDNVNLGNCYVVFSSNIVLFSASHTFKIQEFRTPEFSSTASVDASIPFVVNSVAIVTGKAEYYSGGGLSSCDANWRVSQNNSFYSPPGWSTKGFSFINNYYPLTKEGQAQLTPNGGQVSFKGVTNSKGEHKLCVDFKENNEALFKKPVSITANLDVQDINRQTISASTTFTVHPSTLYVGLKSAKYFARAGDIVPVDLIVTDINGKVQKDVAVEIKVFVRNAEMKGYEWIMKEAVVQKLDVMSGENEVKLNVEIKEGGNYTIFASIKDNHGLCNYSSCGLWVAGGSSGSRVRGKNIQRESVKLIANKVNYKVGEVAKILVSSPFETTTPVNGFFVVYGMNGFVQRERFRLKRETSSIVLSVPIKKTHIPNVRMKVYLAGVNYRVDETGRPNVNAPKRPAYASGSLVLEVPAELHTIDVTVDPPKIMKPGEKGEVKVVLSGENVKDSLVSLIMVDEAVLSLTGYNLPHPIGSFLIRNNQFVQDKFTRSMIFVKDWKSIKIQGPVPPPQSFSANKAFSGSHGSDWACCAGSAQNKAFSGSHGEDWASKPSNGPAGAAEKEKAIQVRSNFKPLTCFISDQKCDSSGKATFKFTLPDNLTRYRVWVLATNTAEYFGLGESSIQTQLPIAVRPSLPRFLNFGDKSDFTVVIQNQTLEKVVVNVAVKMTNLKMQDQRNHGIQAIIPYTKRAEIRFPVETTMCGTGRFQVIAAVAGTEFADAIEKEIPIFTPSTSEAFATYGEIDKKVVVQTILPPPDIYNEFGGIEITTSSTALQSLTDAFLYLFNYEFNCVEQISSKMMSIFALKDILSAFNVPKMPSKRKMDAVVKTGGKKIRSAQRSDGGIGFWSIRSDVNIYLSIHVAHVLIRGVEQGYKIDTTLLNRSKSFCQNVEKYINRYCKWYGPYSRASLRAFALYALTQYQINKKLSSHEKDLVVKQAESLYRSLSKYLSHEGKAWLIFALFYCSPKKLKHPIVVKVLKNFMNSVNETAETANFITSYGDDGKLVMLHSNRRTDAILLEILIHMKPKEKLIVKLVKGLLAHKKKGRWNSTQENVYILLALKKYFKTFEKVTPNFVAQMWLGNDFCGEVKFRGRETDSKIVNVPMKYLVPDDSLKDYEKKDLVLSKKGKGRLYYRIGMDYAPKNLKLKPVDYGFIVERTYEGVADKSHAVFDEKNDVWVFKAGEMIRTKLKMTNNSRRYHVALVDFLPAGCEVMNPELKGQSPQGMKATSGSASTGTSKGRWGWSWWYYRPWYEHHNLRDERVEAFASYLYCGEHEFSYLMRATSFGEYVIPPTKAEEMYSPEIFGRSSSEKVIIK